MMMNKRAACFLAALAFPVALDAQTLRPSPNDPAHEASKGTVRLVVNSSFVKHGGAWRYLFGYNWRDVWNQQIEVPVLDLERYAGGLKMLKSGGNQTRTLHMMGADGQRYVFRSVGKSVQEHLGDDLQNTFVSSVIQDHNSANYPSAPTMVDVIQRAAGVLHPAPRLYMMPDDPRLGEFRAEYANLLGHIEIKPDDVEDGVKMFGNAEKIIGTDKLLANLDESLENRLDARAYLRVRLLDAMIGDYDRGADQWDFARYTSGGVKTYAPIARDRDWAFLRSNGLLIRPVRMFYSKIGSFDDANEDMQAVTFMTHEFDRAHLVVLSWNDWQSVMSELRAAVTDNIIEQAIAAQPAPFSALTTERMRAGLRARRDGLPELARKYYAMVNREADVFAADSDDSAEIIHAADGTVNVRIMRLKKDGSPATDEGYAVNRTFSPNETREVRVYMQEGDDRVTISGSSSGAIKVRVTGGAGDDVITDQSRLEEGTNEIYDASGRNTITPGRDTDVHLREYTTGQPSGLEPDKEENKKPRKVDEERRGRFRDQWNIGGADFATQRTVSIASRFWGGTSGIIPALDLRDGAGLVLGGGFKHTEYGFRSEPFSSRTTLKAMYGTGASRFAVEATGEWHPGNSNQTIGGLVRLSGFESQRYSGSGNDSERLPEDATIVLRDEFLISSTMSWSLAEHTSFGLGPVLRMTQARPPAGSPAAVQRPLGYDAFGQLGAQGFFRHSAVDHESAPHSGYRAMLGASTFGAIQNGDGVFGKASAVASAYIPLGAPTIALRAGGQRAFGNYPIHEAAMLGGRESLRGFGWNRFSGDAAVFGNAELRVPVVRVELLVRGTLGFIGLTDAGRVWSDGNTNNDWHTSYGGGLSFTSLGKAVSAVFAHGEENRVYLNLGLPF